MGINKDQETKSLLTSKWLPSIIIGYGIILRIVQYLYNGSLFIDEARDTVVGILGRSFSDLFGPTPSIFTPSPPLGFFVIEKLCVQFFGDSEYVLRLFPLIAGIFSLLLFYYVARLYISPKAIPLALILFATLEPLIYYSSSARPYSSDVAFALLIFLIIGYIYKRNFGTSSIICFGVFLGMIVWFSGPSIFVLAGAGTSIALFALIRKEWSKIRALSVIYLFWSISFIFYYFLYLRNIMDKEFTKWVANSFKGENAFVPFPPLSFSDVSLLVNTFITIFKDNGFLYVPGVAALSFILGCIALFRDRRDSFCFLLLPIFFTLAASAAAMYPFGHRMILFLVPSFLLIISTGIEFIKAKTLNSPATVSTVVAILLLFHPVASSVHHVFKPIRHEETKPVLSYIRKNWQEGDTIYLHYRAHPAFEYYRNRYGFNKLSYIVGVYAGERNNLWAFSTQYLQMYTKDLDQLKGKRRVWIFFSETPLLRKKISEEVFFTYYLNTIGKQLNFFKSEGAAVYLYDLGASPTDSQTDNNRPKALHWYF